MLDLRLRGDEDKNHLTRATEMGYVLCTHDSDYVELAAAGMEHTRVVIGNERKHHIGEWIKGLELIHGVYTAEDMRNRVEYL